MSDGVQARAGDEAPVSSSEAPLLPKRRLWPFLLLLVAVVAGGAVLIWRSMTAPFPLRVLVAVDVDGYWWEGSKPAAQLADELGDYLSKLGFEPVRAGDPETAEILEDAASPHEAARTLRAAFVITATIRPDVIEQPIEGGFFEIHIDAPVRVSYFDKDAPVAERKIHTFAGAKTKDDALRYAAQSAARHCFDVALPAMMDHQTVKEIVEGKDPKLVDQLAPAVTFVQARQAELDKAAGAYKDLAEQRKTSEKSTREISFHSALDADDKLLGVGPKGLLINSAPVSPFYSPATFEVLRNIGLETIAWRPLAASTEQGASQDKQLWRGYNSFTYPTVADEGRPVLMIEELYGWARALTAVDVGGKVTRLKVSAEHKLSEPKVSPGGRAVAFVDRACRRCPKEISVVDLVSQKEIWRLDQDRALSIGEFAWLDDARLMVVFELRNASADEASRALWGVDVRDGAYYTLLVPKGSAWVSSPAASPDGKMVAAAHNDGDAIVSMDPVALQVRTHPVGGDASALSFSPDGSRVAFQIETRESPYTDIAVLDLDSSQVTRLTKNQSPDRYPVFSPDGKRVFFEARNTDPVFGRRRAVVRVASVQAP